MTIQHKLDQGTSGKTAAMSDLGELSEIEARSKSRERMPGVHVHAHTSTSFSTGPEGDNFDEQERSGCRKPRIMEE